MPVTQKSSQYIQAPTVYTNAFVSAPSVARSSGASWITPRSLAPDRPGTVAGGLSMADITALADLPSISGQSVALRPIALPTSSLIGRGSEGTTSGAVRTGSLTVDMLDVRATIEEASGQFIGQRVPLLGGAESTLAGQGPGEMVLSALGNYGTLPSKILDYTVGLPLALMGFNKSQVGEEIQVNPNGTPKQPFQKSVAYWEALSLVTDDSQLVTLATQVANATVGQAIVPAMTEKLLGLFRSDWYSLSGMSTGNERADYLQKKQLQGMLEFGKIMHPKSPYTDPYAEGFWTPEALAGTALYTTVATSLALFTALPFVGTQMAQFLAPVSQEAEDAWKILSNQQRMDFQVPTQIQMTAADFATMMPLFGGLGAAIGFMRDGAAGVEFGASTIRATSGNSLLNTVQHAAWLLGKPGVSVPAALTREGQVGRLLATTFGRAVPEVVHLPNVYDGVLFSAKLAMAEGISSWAITQAASAVSPWFNENYGKEINSSHWVSDSVLAGAVDQIGLFAGGTMGLTTALRFNRFIAGKAVGMTGLDSSPMIEPVATHYGSIANRVWTNLGISGKPMQPAVNHVTSMIQRVVQQGKIMEAQRLFDEGKGDRGAEVLANAVVSNSQASESLAKLIKAAFERDTGLETEGARLERQYLRKNARELLNQISHMMEEEHGASYWSGILDKTMGPEGKPLALNDAGLREWIKQAVSGLGKDGEAFVKDLDTSPEVRSGLTERGKVTPWQQAANAVRQSIFDGYSGTLKDIQGTGTSEQAPRVFVVRTDSLWSEVAEHFISLVDDKDMIGAEMLRLRMIQTPQVLEWWGKLKAGAGGANRPEDITVKDLYHYAKQMKDHLPSKRPTPGPMSEEGSLNDLHIRMEKQGQYTLAFKPTATTAIGVMEEQMKASIKELEDWTVARDTSRQAAIDASKAVSDRSATIDTDLYTTKVQPAADKLNALIDQRPALQAAFNALPDAASPAATKLAVQIAKLDADIHKADLAYKRAPDRIDKVKAADPEMKRLVAAEDAALKASNDIAANKPLGYRIGPVSPPGFTPDGAEIFSDMGQGADAVWTMMEADAAVDPNVGDGIYHVTTRWDLVQKYGLLNGDEQAMNGFGGVGLGGGGIRGHLSLTYSKLHADAISSRLKAAVRAVNGDLSMEEMLLHFKNQPPSLTKRGQMLWGALRKIDDPVVRQHDYNAQGHVTGMVKDDLGHIIDMADYANWLKEEIAKEMKSPYQTADEVAAALSDWSRTKFKNEWNQRLNEWTAPKPTWGSEGQFVTPEVRLANGMTIEEANTALANIVDKYPGVFKDTATAADRAAASQLTHQMIHAEWVAKHPGTPPTEMQKWEILLDLLENPPADGLHPYQMSPAHPVYDVLQALDQRMEITPGGGVLILNDGSQFLGLSPDQVGVVRVSVNLKAIEEGRVIIEGDPTEVRIHTDDLFVHQALPDQPHMNPIEHPFQNWSELGPTHIPVSYVTVRDPTTGKNVYLQTQFLDYPMTEEFVNVGNRGFLMSKIDGVGRGVKTWRLTEYMKAQTHRLFTTNYDVEPALIDAFLARVFKMGYEKWSPGGSEHGQVPLGYQATAILRAADVRQAAMDTFGKVEHPTISGEFIAAPIRNKITGKMEVPDYPTLLADGFRQAWTMNFTSALTSRFYALGSMGPQALHGTLGGVGYGGILVGQWVIPILRYMLSAVFKSSELVESKGFNAMRGTPQVDGETIAAYRRAGMPYQRGQIATELGAGDTLAQGGLMGGLPNAAEAQAMFPSGLADITDSGMGYAFEKELIAVANERSRMSHLSGKVRDGWRSIADPTPFKDGLATDLVIQGIRTEFPVIMARVEPTAYGFYTEHLKVPPQDLADFFVKDHSLYQDWQDELIDWKTFTDFHAKYNKDLAEPTTPEMEAFYKSEEWQATEAMFRLNAKTSQSEAFGVHYFGSYRSPLERSINHPLLGVYPASWAYKAAKEWFKFLFDNRTFGNGELRLGASPAAYLQSMVNAQAVLYAKTGGMDGQDTLDEWLNKGPYAQGFFLFNLLLPGDWSNLPFPMSRSIRMVLRDPHNLSLTDHIQQNIFGTDYAPGGIGVIRDFRFGVAGIQSLIDQMSGGQPTPIDLLSQGLDSNGSRAIPADFDKVTKYPSTVTIPPLLNETR